MTVAANEYFFYNEGVKRRQGYAAEQSLKTKKQYRLEACKDLEAVEKAFEYIHRYAEEGIISI